MANVAERLGFTTMSLYRYVSSKDDLLALMFDAAIGDVADAGPPPRAGGRGCGGGREGLFAVYRLHPWALDIPITGPPALPNQLAWLDWGLAELDDTGLEIGERLSVMLLLSGYVRNVAMLTRDLASGHERAGSTPAAVQADYEALLGSLVTARRFPALHAAVRGGLSPTATRDDLEFEFGLATHPRRRRRADPAPPVLSAAVAGFRGFGAGPPRTKHSDQARTSCCQLSRTVDCTQTLVVSPKMTRVSIPRRRSVSSSVVPWNAS